MSIRIGIGIDITKPLSKALAMVLAYFARVTAAGGVTEGKECLATKLNSLDAIQLLDNASLVTIPSGYKSGVVYSQVPTSGAGDLDFTRASTATRINSSSLIESVATGVPRLDYPIGGGCPSLLLEPQRTNISNYIESGNGNFQTADVTLTTSILGLTTFRVTANALLGDNPSINSNIEFQANTPYTFSFYTDFSKCTGSLIESFFLGFFPSVAFAKISINKTTKAFTTDNVGGVFTINNYSATQINGEIYKISFTVTTNTTSISGSRNYLFSPSSTGDFAGMQLEAGSYETSFIKKSTASSVTRLAETASKTGISSLIGQTEGTIFLDIVVNNIDNLVSNILNTSKNPSTVTTLALTKIKANNKFSFELFLGNGGFANIPLLSTNTFQNQLRTKVAIRYKSGDLAMYINGNLEATSSATYTIIGTISELFLNDIAVIFGWQESVSFNQLVFYKSGLSNSQLASLTTI